MPPKIQLVSMTGTFFTSAYGEACFFLSLALGYTAYVDGVKAVTPTSLRILYTKRG